MDSISTDIAVSQLSSALFQTQQLIAGLVRDGVEASKTFSAQRALNAAELILDGAYGTNILDFYA